MDAHFFRFLAHELGPRLTGARIGKIFAPAPGVWSFELDGRDIKDFLLFRPAKSAGLLFLSPVKPVNPATAPARCMWFRKRVSGRRILGVTADWPDLRLCLELSPGEGTHLVLDLRTGPSLAAAPPTPAREPAWPAPEEVLQNPGIWRTHPHISPSLRKLAATDPEAFHETYTRLRTGAPQGFFLPDSDGELPPPLAWPIPGPGLGAVSLKFDSALDAARHQGERVLFPLMEHHASSAEDLARKREIKRVKRNLERLDREEERMAALVRGKASGELIQNELWRIKNLTGLDRLDAVHPVHGDMRVELNPLLTPAENMARWFKQAAKGERGLEHCARRRSELERELDRLNAGGAPSTRTEPADPLPVQEECGHAPVLPKKFRTLAVTGRMSPDGFLVIRGKNKKANHELTTKAASPFDLWFHAEGGPGAHVILKRDHPGQEPHRTSLEFAARMAAEKSWRAQDAKADVLCALVRDVRAIKGADLGRVAVDKIREVIRVDLTPGSGSLAKPGPGME